MCALVMVWPVNYVDRERIEAGTDKATESNKHMLLGRIETPPGR